MEVLEAIKGRRTARMFRNEEVSDDVLNEILEAGTWAPSHGNTQPWEFVIIGPETRKKALKAYSEILENGPLKNPAVPEERKQAMRSFAQNFGGAPVLLAVVCPSANTEMEKYDYPLAAAAAIQNMFLAAWDKKIAGVWLSFGYSQQAQTMLKINPGSTIAGILAMGYAENIPPAQPRIPVFDKLRCLS